MSTARPEQAWPGITADAVRAWADDAGVPTGELGRVLAALESRPRSPHWQQGQRPALFLPGLSAEPWPDPIEYDWVTGLEAEAEIIRDEFLGCAALSTAHPESDTLVRTGRWRSVELMRAGVRNKAHCRACPATSAALARIPGANEAGLVYFSVLEPGATVTPHCAQHNARIRCHLGLVTPEGGGISVGGQIRTWRAGTCLLFDDSFAHAVWNRGERARVVLLLDVWHPELTTAERAAFQFFYRRRQQSVPRSEP